MNSNNLIGIENGGTQISPCQCKDRQSTDKLLKYFIIIFIIWLVGISGLCFYNSYQINARRCICLQADGIKRKEDVKVESEVISSVLQEDNGNTPQDVKREKRNVITSDGQVSQSIYFSLRLYLMASFFVGKNLEEVAMCISVESMQR